MRLSGLLLCVGMLLSVGCGKKNKVSNMPDRFMDTKLQFYLEEFVIDARSHGVNIDGKREDALRVLKFVDNVDDEKKSRGQPVSAEAGTIGTCANFEEQKTINAGFKTFKTDSYDWNEVWIASELGSESAHPLALKELIYHELGHCLLGLDHVEAKPHKIMSPEMSLNGKWLTSNWDHLMTELFDSAK